MRCPKCNVEIPDQERICNLCGYSFDDSAAEKPKTSKLAIVSLVLGLLSIPSFLITAIPAIILGLIAIIKISKKNNQIKGITTAISGIALSTISIIFTTMAIPILWSLDAPPIPNDYTIKDLRSAPSEYNESYVILTSFADPNNYSKDIAESIGLTKQEVNDLCEIRNIFRDNDLNTTNAELEKNSEIILEIWENAQKGRTIIKKLNEFPEIADMTEPTFDYDSSYLGNLRSMVMLFQIYSCLKTNTDNDEEAVEKLLILNSLSKKLSLNARSIVAKLVSYGALTLNIQTANYIINNSNTSNDSLLSLAEHFQPLDKEYLSLRNPIIFEYLTFRNEMIKILKKTNLRYSPTPFLKFNSSMRVYKNHCDSWIEREENQQPTEDLKVWPARYPNIPITIDPNGRLPWYYTAYNPIGSLLTSILLPVFERVTQIKTRTQIYDDLLQIVLNIRLGRDIDLKARAYSDEYIIDIENKKILSPGPDGEVDTEDDILLPINPQVLNLTE
jgi:hypothetical protein